ncbi:hypothetical protein ABID19_002157 [Mesorhizobium robiniae]|uniref:ABC transmembrane type-1 domain-containing protein n=1 Tax=Mesorhizobium robiniae TaxID=559315 RepID=A0ABV2GLG6_9HYPH
MIQWAICPQNQSVTILLYCQAATAADVGKIAVAAPTLLFGLAFLFLEKLVAFLHTSIAGRLEWPFQQTLRIA